MTNWDKAIEILTSGVSKELAEELLKQFCPKMFGLETDMKILNDYGHTRCDLCWSKTVKIK